jgi:UDP-glucose 4-epimerase
VENKFSGLFEGKKILVTGAAGFIGSHVVDVLISNGSSVFGVDNLSTGKLANLNSAMNSVRFQFINGDLLDFEFIKLATVGVDYVFHFSANADIRFGTNNPELDFYQNIVVTKNILESMRINQVKKIVFASTGAIYGEATQIPTPENAQMPIQTSLYGASKISAEAIIQAYSESFDIQSWIFRFVSILGARYAHGHVYDFLSQLNKSVATIKVLGNGNQEKSYLHIEDCLTGIMTGVSSSNNLVNIFNLGTNETLKVRESLKIIIETLGVKPEVKYEENLRGWIGDNPLIFLDTSKIRKFGWTSNHTIESSINSTVSDIINRGEFENLRKVSMNSKGK